jgi:polyisoprenoid-binding protein YceI
VEITPFLLKKKMKKILVFGLILAANLAFAQTWTPTTSQVTFKIKMLGVNVDGTLKGMKTNLKFNGNEPVALSATLDASTINTSNSLRDKHLKEKDEFLQPNLFPTLAMSSVSIQKNGENNYVGIFKITIKDQSKNVKVPFTFKEENGKGSLKSSFEINRQDWKFGGSTPGMSDNVKVSIVLNLAKN